MRIHILTFLLILTSCRSVELKQPVWYFWPIKLHLGTDISVISGQLSIDTTKYAIVGHAKHLREFTLRRAELDKLDFYNNYADSIKLNFFNNRLYSVNIFASGNRNVEYLKFEVKGPKESGLGVGSKGKADGTFRYGQYSELSYYSKDRHLRFYYIEDIIDNTATLEITNAKMIKMLPPGRHID